MLGTNRPKQDSPAFFSADRRDPPAQEQTMKEISQEVLDHIPDPIAKLVSEKRMAD